MVLPFTDWTNARRRESAETEVQSETNPAQFVTRLGIDIGFPVRELTLIW